MAVKDFRKQIFANDSHDMWDSLWNLLPDNIRLRKPITGLWSGEHDIAMENFVSLFESWTFDARVSMVYYLDDQFYFPLCLFLSEIYNRLRLCYKGSGMEANKKVRN